MKHLIKLALLGAAALVAASCQRELVEGADNPNYNPETDEVVTSFVFNVATQAKTKQSDEAVQATSSDLFRGITDAKLLSYAITTNHKGILPADATADKVFNLTDLATSSLISWEENRRVMELSLPIKTNTLLLYGRAPLGDSYGGFSKNDCYGHMDSYSVDVTTGSANFKAGQRLANDKYNDFLTVENLFAGIQSTLLNHSIAAGTEIKKGDPANMENKYAFDAVIPTGGIKWEDYNNNNGLSPYKKTLDRFPLEDKLGNLYDQLTDIKTSSGELRAGSGEAVIKMATDLLSVLNEIRCAAPLNDQEAVAKYFANEVYTRVMKYFDANTNNNGAAITGVTFRSLDEIGAAYLSNAEKAFRPDISDFSGTDAEGLFWPDETDLAAIADYDPAEFPFNFNLPRGATHIGFDKGAKIFYYPQTFNVSGMGMPGAGSVYNAKSYYYPAELLYFGNSPVRTTDKDLAKADYPKGSGTGGNGTTAPYEWCNDNAWTAWTGTKVEASTHAVAMRYNVNYGVGVLKTQVKYQLAEGKYIYDNNHAIQAARGLADLSDPTDEPDNKLEVTNDMFDLTGVIIGGVPVAIGWDHLPVKINLGTTQEPNMQYQYGFIYDKAIDPQARDIPKSGTSEPNYTLVYDNFLASGESGGIYTAADVQNSVSVALEFQNNSGKDFYGNHNIIRDGGYFYLIGLLNPNKEGLAALTWPDDEDTNITHIVPPYTAEGRSQKVKRVFIQDFMTSVTFTIGPESLHSAYLTVPDLRSTSMTFGLSVDLNWETGLDFGEIVLGQ